MRRARFLLLMFATLVSIFGVSQVNWTPSALPEQEPSAFRALGVKMVTLTPEQARNQYNIEITKGQQFVSIDTVRSKIPAIECHQTSARCDFRFFDIVDTVILGGEMPQHGQVRDLSDFRRFESLCKPGCLVLVRHIWSHFSEVNVMGIIDLKFSITVGRTPRYDHSMPKDSLEYARTAWSGFCDKQTKYFFTYSNDVSWLSPNEFRDRYGLTSCEVKNSAGYIIQPSLVFHAHYGSSEPSYPPSVPPSNNAPSQPTQTQWIQGKPTLTGCTCETYRNGALVSSVAIAVGASCGAQVCGQPPH